MSEQIPMQPISIKKIWAELSQQRMAWAFRAYDNFINSLSDDVREHFPKGDEKGEAYVVVFGKTQVGKTTLILDLMGISGNSLKRVSNVLRGGRESGKSATATAMEYRRSDDNQWRFSSGAELTSGKLIQYDDSGMREVLGDVRKEMFQKRLRAEKPFIVWIPNDCFDSDKNADFSVRMLDLPGDYAADAVERKHVQVMAQKYVPNADLILLVGKGDDLSFLRPASLELPSIEDWQIVPNRFRIITTYSFTAQSVRDAIQQQKTIDAEFFRKRLLEQISTFGLKLDGDSANMERFFPLEFGDSWVNAKEDLVNKLKPVISSLKNQLHQDIKASATPTSRLRNAISVYVTVGKIKQSRLKQMDESLSYLKEQQTHLIEECTITKKAHHYAQMQTEAAEKFAGLFSDEKLTQYIQNGVTLDITTMLKKVDELKTNTRHFKSLINQFTSELKSQFLNKNPTKRTKDEYKFWAPVQPNFNQYLDSIEELVDTNFETLRKRFFNYSTTEYYPNFSDDFSDDKYSMRIHMRTSASDATILATKLWENLAKERFTQLVDEIESRIANQNALQNALEERSQALEKLNIKIEKSKQERNTFVNKIEADETSSRNFIELLERTYFAELRSRFIRIINSPNATHAFVELLATDQLMNERKKLLNTLS